MLRTNSLKLIRFIGYAFASSVVNFSCMMIFGQEKLPDDLKRLRKF